MICETCYGTGLIRQIIPCHECGGHGVIHCCDGLCEQPEPEEYREIGGEA